MPAPLLLLTIDQVADALGIGRRMAYKLRARPNFPAAVSLGPRCVRYRLADLDAWLKSQTGAECAEPAQLSRGRGLAGGLAGGLAQAVPAKRLPVRVSVDRMAVEPPARVAKALRQTKGGAP